MEAVTPSFTVGTAAGRGVRKAPGSTLTRGPRPPKETDMDEKAFEELKAAIRDYIVAHPRCSGRDLAREVAGGVTADFLVAFDEVIDEFTPGKRNN